MDQQSEHRDSWTFSRIKLYREEHKGTLKVCFLALYGTILLAILLSVQFSGFLTS